MGSLPGTSRNLEYGMAETIRNRPAGRGAEPGGPKPRTDRHAAGARDPHDVLNTDDPVSWADRFRSKPAESILCPHPAHICDATGPHVHDRAGTAHPVDPDTGRWQTERPPPPAPHWTTRRRLATAAEDIEDET